VHVLATGEMPVSVGFFGYRCDSCELEDLDYHSNLGLWSCLDIV
jgi:hypothetical protein